jgi:hypothetical protein
MAEAHVYGNQLCSSVSCFNTDYAPLARADAHAVGYLAWTRDTWGGCGVLINNFNGTPANQYAQWVHEHYVTAFP